ncbi:NADH-quinone oxidoreductase subunit C [Campylobacter sp. JMF_08 NE1]|uniref:NADH-quinone oxidoreductase subunit D-related protein n=1 Tax=Campylobacter sp. JMF_08 NE1 TaxID=2983821 RepID=UPI0022E9EA74|nr:NADH-quinone oxidoreductase subunit C [Campylobacter sp. JMF_08 NE1]MDA3047482.1 NADH-quinone oxidoreductase subunit C [Campylobacter sp. JMF_08 NE1]
MIGDLYISQIESEFNILETTRQTDKQITILVDRNDLPAVVNKLYYGIGGWLVTMVANDERSINKHFALYYVLSMEGSKFSQDDELEEKCFITVKALIPADDPVYPSVTPLVKAAVWYEREAFDLFGLRAEGLIDPRRLAMSDDWPLDLYPLRKDEMNYKFRPDPLSVEPDYEFKKPKGVNTQAIPLGPLHITADEPGHFRLYCDGDTIVDADYRLYYQHRGMEKLAENRMNYTQMAFLAERVCGICGFAHSIAMARATENAMGLEIPERAQALRIMSAEVERLHSNLLNIGLACEVTGNYTAFMHVFRVREYTLDLAQILTGGRKTYGTVTVGGMRRDIRAKEIKEILNLLSKIEQEFEDVWEVIINDERQMSRWKGIGVLDPQVGRDYGSVGPTIRASGFKRDVRYDYPDEFTKKLKFNINTETSCDVYGRVKVRYHDTKDAISVIRQCIDIMPGGDIIVNSDYRVKPNSYAIGYIEAPRGEDIHWIMQSGSQKVYRWRVKAPTFSNWPALAHQLRGYTVADAALIVCSLDPCYSCTERLTVVDIKSGKSKILAGKELKAICQKGN